MVTMAGTAGNDILTGTEADDLFLGSAGVDTIAGGGGLDTLSYAAYGQAIRVTLSDGGTGTVDKSPSLASYDRFTGIEVLVGTGYDDVFIGNVQFGSITFVGGAGRDTFYGQGRGINTVSYADSAARIIVDVASGTVLIGANYAESDRIVDVVSIIGSTGDDLFFGGAGALETFSGNAGNDTFLGGAAPSGALGGGFYGGAGTDTVQFVSALSDLTFTFIPGRFGGGAFYVSSLLNGSVLIDSVERITAGGKTYGQGVGVSGVDTLTYYLRNPDVARAGLDAEAHYFSTGWREGRNPNDAFITSDYLAANPDVRAAGINPLLHYLQVGAREGRDPGLSFDSETYLALNPDIRAAGINPLLHYLDSGRLEGRPTGLAIGRDAASDGFDAQYYLLRYRDIAAAGIDAEAHYRSTGFAEGRNPNAFFSGAGYLAAYDDVRALGIDPLTHYLQFGWREGRDPSPAFDTTAYLAANPDVTAAGINPLLHYLGSGHAEGRLPISDGLFDLV